MLVPLLSIASFSAGSVPHVIHLLQIESSTGSNGGGSSGFSLDFAGGAAIEGIIAVLIMIIGLILVFSGARIIKLAIWLVSLIFVGGLFFYLIYTRTGNALGAFLGGLFLGIFFACLIFCIWKIAVFLLGCCCGFICWLGFRTLFPNAITNEAGLYILLVFAIIAVGIIALIFENFVLVVLTAIVGSFLFSQGLDHWTQTNFNVFGALHGDDTCNVGGCFGIALGFLILAVVGVIVQEKWTKGILPTSKCSICPCIPCCPV